MSARLHSSGFTLIEVMVVVAVLAILLGIAAPSFQSMLDKRRLIGAAEQLYADLQYARSEAIKRNASVTVSFSPGTNWCYGIALAACACGVAGSCQLDGVDKVVSSGDFRGVSLPPGSPTFTFAAASATFEPRRGTAPGGNGTATLRSTTGDIEVIVGSLGRVRICSTSPNLRQYAGTC